MKVKNYIPEDCHFCFENAAMKLTAEQGEDTGKPLISLYLCKLHYEELKTHFKELAKK